MKFVYGSEKDFYDFFNELKSEDKIAVLGHDDLDGIGSVVMLKHILESKGFNLSYVDFLTLKPEMFQTKIKELRSKKINKIFILDVSGDTVDFDGFVELRKNFDVFLLDHHPINLKIKGFDNILKVKDEFCVGYVIFELGKKICDMKKFNFLACVTIISDVSYRNSETCFDFVKKHYPNFVKEKALESEPGKFANLVSLAIIYFKKDLKKVYELILENKTNELKKYAEIVDNEISFWTTKFKKEAEFYSEKHVYIYYIKPKYNIASIMTTNLSFDDNSCSFIILSDLNEDKNYIKISGRSNGNIRDLNELFKKSIKRLDNAIAGGHTQASGGRIMKKDIEIFKKNILNNIK